MKALILTTLRKCSWIEGYLPSRLSIRIRFFLQRYLDFLEPEFDLLPVLVDAKRAAIDVGANTGIFTYRLMSLASEVYAFEPISWLAERLAAAKLEKVRVEEVALSDASGVATIRIPLVKGVIRHTRASLNTTSGESLERDVILKPLDHYGLDNIGFIKIDVEGHEYPLLVGAENTILRNRPNIFIEIESWRLEEGGVQKILALFERWGFEGFFYWRGKRMAAKSFDARAHQANRSEIYKDDDYVNNFIFIPLESSIELPETL